MLLLLVVATLQIPHAAGPLTIDGRLDEPIWRQARVLALGRDGGETRVLLRGGYVCLAARLPEPDRVVGFSTRPGAELGREDTITWTFHVRPADVTLTVTPLGGYRATPARGVIAAARVGPGEWTVEAAIPAESLGGLGFLSVERIRVPRPQAPELRWHWPAPNERADFSLPRMREAAEPLVEAAPVRSAAPADRVAAEPASDALGRQLRTRMAEAAARERKAWERVRTLEDWEAFRNQRLAALRASLGSFPERTPLRPAVTRRANYGDGFVVENVVYESRPHLLVTANLYLPAKVSGRVPAILVVHSHHAAKTQAELQDMGMTWARAGAAVLVPDQLGAGERVQSNPWPRESYYSRYALGIQLHLAGESLMKWMVWDLMRSVDLLLDRPEIDPARIVLLGAVAGGGDPAAVTAALDERIAAVIPFNFGEAGPEEHYTEGPRQYDPDTADPGWGSWETTRNLWRSAAEEFFPWFICASVAPRRFMYSFEIDWPNGVEREPAWARYRRVFSLYDKSQNLAEVHGLGPFPGPGECTNVGAFLRKRIYPVLKRWLDMPVPAQEYHHPRPESDLIALTPELAASREPKAANEVVLAIARDRLQRATRSPGALRSKLGDIEPDPRASIPSAFLKPDRASGRVPVVIVFSQQGKRRYLAERGADVKALLAAGIAVCLPDVRGTGQTAPANGRGPQAMSAAATELMLGATLFSAQLKDARSVLAQVRGRDDVDPSRILLFGDSLAQPNPEFILPYESIYRQLGPRPLYQAEPLGPLLALFTALYESDVRVATRRGLSSFMSVLEDRFCYVPLDVVVPGILEAGDIPDVVAALGPRALVEGSLDGRNRPIKPGMGGQAIAWLIRQAKR